jgi:hypothetical protein
MKPCGKQLNVCGKSRTQNLRPAAHLAFASAQARTIARARAILLRVRVAARTGRFTPAHSTLASARSRTFASIRTQIQSTAAERGRAASGIEGRPPRKHPHSPPVSLTRKAPFGEIIRIHGQFHRRANPGLGKSSAFTTIFTDEESPSQRNHPHSCLRLDRPNAEPTVFHLPSIVSTATAVPHPLRALPNPRPSLRSIRHSERDPTHDLLRRVPPRRANAAGARYPAPARSRRLA